MTRTYRRHCQICGEWIYTSWLSRLWAFDREHTHTEERA